MDIKQLQTELAACKSYHDVFAVMRRELSAIGYDIFGYGFQILESFKTPPVVIYSTYKEEWIAEYMANNYALHDPIMYHYTHIRPLCSGMSMTIGQNILTAIMLSSLWRRSKKQATRQGCASRSFHENVPVDLLT